MLNTAVQEYRIYWIFLRTGSRQAKPIIETLNLCVDRLIAKAAKIAAQMDGFGCAV